MIKKIPWRKVIYIFTWTVSLSGLFVLMSFIDSKRTVATCSELKIVIPGAESFIQRQDVDNLISNSVGPLLGRKLSTINIHRIEDVLKANPFVRDAKVYADMDGIIHINVEQRVPVLRVLNMANVHYYVDREGMKMPVSTNYTARALVANGMITEDFNGRVDTISSDQLRDLFSLAQFIQRDSLWNDQIEQIFVDLSGDVELVPRVGEHTIVLGSVESLEEKFRNLLVFYKKALPKVGWDTYKTINVKYANQIVCERGLSVANDTLKVTRVLADTLIIGRQDSI